MTDLSKLKHRDDLGAWLNEAGLLGVGVEVGALNGANAKQILSQWKGATLILVDTWGNHEPNEYIERTDWTNFDACFDECVALAKADPRVKLLTEKSIDAAKEVEDGFLDFAYIDANHGLHGIAADIHAWWPKVKSGGLFAGHDNYVDTVFPSFCEVKYAVDALARRAGLPIHTTPCTSWWFVKP